MKKICDICSFQGNKSIFNKVGSVFTEIDNLENVTKEDIIYLSSRKIQEHFFRIFQGYGLSVVVYNQLIQHNVTKVILNIEGVKLLLSNLSQWKKSNRWINETLDGQIDNQYILQESDMILLKVLKGGNNTMNISEFTKATNMFLKAEEVKKNPTSVFIITIEPILIDSEFEGKKTKKVRVEGEFNKEPRQFDLSKTNARTIEKALGSDTEKWIGHQLILSLYQTMSSKGKLVDAILVKEVK